MITLLSLNSPVMAIIDNAERNSALTINITRHLLWAVKHCKMPLQKFIFLVSIRYEPKTAFWVKIRSFPHKKDSLRLETLIFLF